MPYVIECTSLTKRFGSFTALDAVDLKVPRGAVLGYLGPNGSGKSTTIRMLLGLSRPSSGMVRVLGSDPAADTAVRGRIGYAPGELRLDDRLTVRQTLESWTRLRPHVDQAYRDELVQKFAVGLDKQVRGLSTGNRRKIGLIGAFMARPELLILDEPTNGLDPLMQEVFLETAAQAAAEGATILLSSHVMSEVERIADEVVVLRSGRVVAAGTMAEMRGTAAQRFRITFDGEGPAIGELRSLDGAQSAESTGEHQIDVQWSGPPTDLIHLLGQYRIKALTAPEPDLVDAFFKYYRTSSDTTASTPIAAVPTRNY